MTKKNSILIKFECTSKKETEFGITFKFDLHQFDGQFKYVKFHTTTKGRPLGEMSLKLDQSCASLFKVGEVYDMQTMKGVKEFPKWASSIY